MDTPTTPNTAYHVPAVSQLRPNIWGWWIGLTMLGGIIGEFFAAVFTERIWYVYDRAIDDYYLEQYGEAIIHLLLYSVIAALILCLIQGLVYRRLNPLPLEKTPFLLTWLISWIIIFLIDQILQGFDPYGDPWIIQSALAGGFAGIVGGSVQMRVVHRILHASYIWIISSGVGLMVGTALFKVFVQDRIGITPYEGTYHSSYYLGRLYQWAIYGVITGLTLEWLVRFTNKRRS